MADIELWPSDAKTRGYDHPLDRLVTPSTEACLYFNENQQELTQEQLVGIEEPSQRVATMLKIASKRREERDEWERLHLAMMRIQTGVGSAALDGYRLASKPEKLVDYIQWFSQYTEELPETVESGPGVIDFSGVLRTRDALENELRNKGGYALSIGSAIQMGDWARSRRLDRRLDEALKALPKKGYDVVEYKQAPTGPARRRHRFQLIEDLDHNIAAMLVVRERGRANVLRQGADELDKVHVVKRSEAVIPFHGLSAEAARTVLGWIATSSRPYTEVDDPDQPLQKFINSYETAIHRHESASWHSNGDQIPISPLSLTYILRNRKRRETQ